MRLRRFAVGTVLLAAPLGLAACSSVSVTNSTSGPPAVLFAIAVPQPGATASRSGHLVRLSTSGMALRPLITATDGDTTLTISSVEAVFKEMELQWSSATSACTVVPAGQTSDSDQCDEFQLGPTLADFPISTPGSPARVALGFAKQQTYSSFWFRFHRLDPNDSTDAKLLAQRPELTGASIYIRGSWNGNTFGVGISAEQTETLTFQKPVVLGDGSQLGLGVTIDVASWFKDPTTGHLIDPDSIASSESLQSIVAGNIPASMTLQVTQN